ncbi:MULTISPECIES: HD-GYP domain-containing protein [Methylobacterium]|uniref:HD-GYP domain-containing protein n=1 Tax=Methylobacterium TaxID=407 RepID=UPI001FAC9EB4|nr:MULTISPECIES: HD-GYP domain-containing protein [Methylobacterium]
MLVITDDTGRSAGLAQDLAAGAPIALVDLYDPSIPSEPASTLLVDVLDLRPDTAARLRHVLTRTPRGAPLVVLLHKDDPRGRMLALALGATRTLCPPFDIPRLRASLARPAVVPDAEPVPWCALQVASQARNFLTTVFVPDRPLTPAVVDTGSAFIEQAIQDTGIRDWIRAVRRFDDITHQHCLLVAGLAAAFGQALGLGEQECHRLTRAALLHDVGKIHVPTAILNKPGKLDANEMAVMKRHPEMGHAMLAGQSFQPEMLQVVRSHHEMLDGSGYPDKLKAAEIPDLVRVLTVCDIYAALIERRPYKAPMASGKAFAILESMTGRLDATVVDAFRPVAAAFIPRFPQDA